jgi:hypothetical protein
MLLGIAAQYRSGVQVGQQGLAGAGSVKSSAGTPHSLHRRNGTALGRVIRSAWHPFGGQRGLNPGRGIRPTELASEPACVKRKMLSMKNRMSRPAPVPSPSQNSRQSSDPTGQRGPGLRGSFIWPNTRVACSLKQLGFKSTAPADPSRPLPSDGREHRRW